MQFVDAHHHLWDQDRYHYPWLARGGRHPAGDLERIPRRYLLDDFLTDADGLELVKSVHVQAEIDRPDALHETEWLQAIADAEGARGFPHGIVAFADLAADDVERVLEAHARHRNLRGIRYQLNHDPDEPRFGRLEPPDLMRDARWRRGFGLLQRFGLSFDLQIEWRQADEAAALLRRFPEVPAMLDHTGLPRRNDRTSVAGWRTAMYKLAAVPHLSCKISGLAQADFDWTEDHVRPFVLDAIELFGVGRCCFGSNFPVDRLKVDYATLWRTFERITADFTEGERRALFHDNAVRFYRL